MTFPAEGILFNRASFDAAGARLREFLAANDGDYRLQLKRWESTRTLPQNRLFHMWMGELSGWLMKRGKAFATPAWCKDAMKHTWLGYEEIERVDVITGARTRTKELRHTSSLKSGEMFDFMCKVEAWARDIGCILTIPDNCEFMQYRRQVNQ